MEVPELPTRAFVRHQLAQHGHGQMRLADAVVACEQQAQALVGTGKGIATAVAHHLLEGRD